MTKFNCGCRIMTEIISLNGRDQPCWQYMLKTFVNICGKCGKKQMKFQYMENKLMEMEKQRMEIFFQTDDDEEEYDEEYKEQFRNMTDEEIERRIEENTFDPYDMWSPRTREEHDNYWEAEYQASLKKETQPEPEN